MDKVQIATLIAGAIVPFVMSFLKRWITFTKEQVSLLVFAVCFLVASVIYLYESNWNWSVFIGMVAEVYATSQVVYWAVLKNLELDTKIENK